MANTIKKDGFRIITSCTGKNRATRDRGYAQDRAEPIQLAYEDWEKEPKIYQENGCRKDPDGKEGQPKFCTAGSRTETIKLIDGKTVIAQLEGYENYSPINGRFTLQKKPTALLSLSVAAISVVCLISYWGTKGVLLRK